MTRNCFLLFTYLCVFVSAVNAQTVTADYDTNVDFKKFKSFAWLAPGDSVLNRYRADKLYGGYIMHTAGQELKSRGLKADTLKPDAIFMFYTNKNEIKTYSQRTTLTVGVGVGGPGYYVSGYTPIEVGEVTETVEQEGVLKFVMYDTRTGDMVWTGMVEKTFKLTDEVEKIVVDYTVKIFKKYPVKKK